jgi:signal transduction histidine kinase/DNA-binding response OmpR family regulator
MFEEEKVNILVVDDVPEKLLTMEAILEELGQNVVSVSSGREALRRLLNEDFAVILLDINMPDIDGFETAALIRQRERSEHTPIIFVTGFSDEAHTFHGYQLGAVDYILTPVVPEILRAKVSVFVELYQKSQQIKRQAEQEVILAREQAARAAAEEATRRSAFLAEATAALNNSLDMVDTLRSLARAAVPRLADLAGVTVVEEGAAWRSELAWRDPASAEIRMQSVAAEDRPNDDLRTAIDRVLLSGATERLEGISIRNPFAGITVEPLRAAIIRPLVARGRTLGALTLAMGYSGRAFTHTNLELLDELVGRAAVALDNSRLYADIQDNDRRKDEFLAMLGHELRNPLAAIANALEYASVARSDERAFGRAREILSRQVEMMARLVDDLLDVSRITRGKIELRKATVELEGAVRRAVATVEPIITTRQHELSVSLPDHPVCLAADPARLEQILANLLNNAAKYTDPGGRISLNAICQGDQVAIHVRDSGVGIPEHLLPRVFDLFMQGDRSLDRAQGGLGIGLTLVRSLVEMHGGNVEAKSEGLGRGSEFIVRLPCCRSGAQEDSNGSTNGEPSTTSPVSRRVMVVDDNADLVATMTALLKLAGHDVCSCHDGPSAIDAALEYQPDVILIDIGLPGMNGYEVAVRLRQMPNFEQAVLVAITGYGQADDRRRAREAGFDHHLTKPVFFEHLQEVLSYPSRPASARAPSSA